MEMTADGTCPPAEHHLPLTVTGTDAHYDAAGVIAAPDEECPSTTEPLSISDPLPNREITATFDGSCLGNPGPGGYAAVLHDKTSGKRAAISGPCGRNTTNNKAELTAALKALRKIKSGAHVTMVGDSEYVIKGMSERLPRWKKKGWRTSSGEYVANRELWEELEIAASKHARVDWVWQRGHAGHPDNEEADGLARSEAEKLKARLTRQRP